MLNTRNLPSAWLPVRYRLCVHTAIITGCLKTSNEMITLPIATLMLSDCSTDVSLSRTEYVVHKFVVFLPL